ncbi:MAG: nucleotidyltransferase family protein [Candidatus Hydrogenedentes bacterium]|nr:nucleotidyltransferase family protein [Candidatus Hydrogenedentota bacterium]
MTSAEIRRRIAEHRRELEDLEVSSLALFGSAARNEASESSDIDLLVEFRQPVGLFTFYRVQEYLEDLLGTPRVDLVLRRAVIDELKDRIYGEAVPCL